MLCASSCANNSKEDITTVDDETKAMTAITNDTTIIGDSDTAAADETTVPTDDTTTPPENNTQLGQIENKILDLSTFKSTTQNTGDDAKLLMDIYAEAANIVDTHDKVLSANTKLGFKRVSNMYLSVDESNFISANKTVVKASAAKEDTITTASATSLDVYLVFLSIIEQDYNDCIHWVDHDYYSYNYNRLMIPYYFFSTEYKNLGYNTIEELYEAVVNKECELPEDACYISFDSHYVIRIKDNFKLIDHCFDSVTSTVER